MSNYANPIETLPSEGNIRLWIEGQMKEHNLPTLLAFADDGVIWGHWDGSKLVTSGDLDTGYPEINDKTLQQAFAFGAELEVRLFHDEVGSWEAWQIKDDGEVIKESQILWGDKPSSEQPDSPIFQRLLAERKGIPSQLIPVKGIVDENSSIRLDVHHLVDYTESGEAYITISRLAGLYVGKKAEEV